MKLTELDWQDIETAPQDGRPVWVTGWHYGKVDSSRHYCWAYYHFGVWKEAMHDSSTLLYLTHWAKV